MLRIIIFKRCLKNTVEMIRHYPIKEQEMKRINNNIISFMEQSFNNKTPLSINIEHFEIDLNKKNNS